MPALLFKGVFQHSPHNDGSSVVVVRLVPDTGRSKTELLPSGQKQEDETIEILVTGELTLLKIIRKIRKKGKRVRRICMPRLQISS